MLLAVANCICALAQSEDPARYVGHKYWYDPDHEKYVQTEFYRTPSFDKAGFTISKKSRFSVLAHGRGWFQLGVDIPGSLPFIAYLPGRMLRTRLYVPKFTEPVEETFRKASIFEEDPEIISKRIERAAAATPKGPVTQPPWVIKRRPMAPIEEPAPPAEPPVEPQVEQQAEPQEEPETK